jgi:hypothetical protein
MPTITPIAMLASAVVRKLRVTSCAVATHDHQRADQQHPDDPLVPLNTGDRRPA